MRYGQQLKHDARGTQMSLTFEDALRIARGCTDYSGGYRCDPELFEAYQAGVKTVIRALEAAKNLGLADSQIAALHRMGDA